MRRAIALRCGMRAPRSVVVLVFALGCGGGAAGQDAARDGVLVTDDGGGADGGGLDGGGALALPPPNGGLDYQLGGAYPPPAGVTIVSRDREAAPAAGLYNICYVNGFQIQPGEASWWLANHGDLILRDGGGQPVIDPDWNEMLIDTSTAAKRTAVAAIVGDWIRGCDQAGFDAVEIDEFFEMFLADIGNESVGRRCNAGEDFNFTGFVGADFNDRCLMFGRELKQGQRHSNLIIEISARLERVEFRAKYMGSEVFGGGLSGCACDSKHGDREALAVELTKQSECVESVTHSNVWITHVFCG